MIKWHRLFGLGLKDLFTNTPFEVELEIDLSIQQQFLDVVVIRKKKDDFTERLPDGLDNLAKYNLLTYKSFQEPLNDWSIAELIGHFVNYRKQVSKPLLPKTDFRLYAVSTRFPRGLAKLLDFKTIQTGVYEVVAITDKVRIIVLSEVPQTEHNAFWHLYSAIGSKVAFGATNYELHTEDMSRIINQLFENYGLEGINMPYTMEDFNRDYVKEKLSSLTLEERLEGLSTNERLKGLSTNERLEGLSTDEIIKHLSVEEIRDYFEKHKLEPEKDNK